MPRPSRRSRTFRRIPVKAPTGIRLHYRRRKVSRAHCAVCKTVLPAVPQLRSVKMAAIAKSAKRPERPYGGVLCSACTRAKIKQMARA